jgi:hypothetical protein
VQPLVCPRQIIDVAGVERRNAGQAVSHGAGGDLHVDSWYRPKVVGGPGTFLVVADGCLAFVEAFRQKRRSKSRDWHQPEVDGRNRR